MRLVTHYADEKNVLCPKCGYDYVSPVGVLVEPVEGKRSVYINSNGVHTGISNKAEKQRGISIATTFLCEDGHQWDETRVFYKGITIHRNENITTYKVSEHGFVPETIWRD